jgi:hypothetical protein
VRALLSPRETAVLSVAVPEAAAHDPAATRFDAIRGLGICGDCATRTLIAADGLRDRLRESWRDPCDHWRAAFEYALEREAADAGRMVWDVVAMTARLVLEVEGADAPPEGCYLCANPEVTGALLAGDAAWEARLAAYFDIVEEELVWLEDLDEEELRETGYMNFNAVNPEIYLVCHACGRRECEGYLDCPWRAKREAMSQDGKLCGAAPRFWRSVASAR